MAKVSLFEATKTAVVINNPKLDEHSRGKEVLIIRDELTKNQAEILAKRLNNRVMDEDMNPTHREQKFAIHVEMDFVAIPYAGDPYTVKQVESTVKRNLLEDDEYLDDSETIGNTKVKVTVVVLHDKQVPND